MAKKNNHIKSQPLNEIAYQKIKELIVTLKLSPKAQIDEEWVAETLSIGRTPIREALFRLNAEHLVEVIRGRGFFVKDINLKDVGSLFETLLILERSAVALAAKRIRKDQLTKLQKTNANLDQAWRKKEFLQVTLLNSRFHRIVYEATDNPFLITYLNNIQNQTQRLAFLCFSKEQQSYDMQTHAERAVHDHELLIEQLRLGGDIKAIALISEHVKLFQGRVFHFMLPTLEVVDSVPPVQAANS
jgi:DNA-binding GntR family transcriptional regulator